ncbi:MAG: DUF1566 domain-containing protein [Oceanospirillaceae bacterium]|nr:DUF1566 domain-containing protein [Oceanospirillaceae bacterium]
MKKRTFLTFLVIIGLSGVLLSSIKLSGSDKGILRISTDPGDAQIYINGKRKGSSPSEVGTSFNIALSEGTYKISAKKPDGDLYEYIGGKMDVFVADDTIQSIKIELNRYETDKGRLAREAKEEKERQEKLVREEKERQEKLAREERKRQAKLASEERKRQKYVAELKKRSYSKLSATGKLLPDSARQWSCVKDNKTGLVWEVKTDDGGIHDKNNKYRWGGKGVSQTALGDYQGNNKRKPANWDGRGKRHDDWNTLVDGSNQHNLCGFNDWRVPDLYELASLVFCSSGQWDLDEGCAGDYRKPAIVLSYFPNTKSGSYSSSSPHARYRYDSSGDAWNVFFSNGSDGYDGRSGYGRVRLVRDGQ